MINEDRSFREYHSRRLRILFQIERLRGEGCTVMEACAKAGVHHSQYYRWKKMERAEAKGNKEAWKPKSKRPKRLARMTPDSVRERIISVARSGRYRSANAIAKVMTEELGRPIHAATVIDILEREGLYGTNEVHSEDGQLLREKRGLRVKTDD